MNQRGKRVVRAGLLTASILLRSISLGASGKIGDSFLAIYRDPVKQTPFVDYIYRRAKKALRHRPVIVIRFKSCEDLLKAIRKFQPHGPIRYLEILGHSSTVECGSLNVCNVDLFAREIRHRRLFNSHTKVYLNGCLTGLILPPPYPPNISEALRGRVHCQVMGAVGFVNGCSYAEYANRTFLRPSLGCHVESFKSVKNTAIGDPSGPVVRRAAKHAFGNAAFERARGVTCKYRRCAVGRVINLDAFLKSTGPNPSIVRRSESAQDKKWNDFLHSQLSPRLAEALGKELELNHGEGSSRLPKWLLLAPDISLKYHGRLYEVAALGTVIIDAQAQTVRKFVPPAAILNVLKKLYIPEC